MFYTFIYMDLNNGNSALNMINTAGKKENFPRTTDDLLLKVESFIFGCALRHRPQDAGNVAPLDG